MPSAREWFMRFQDVNVDEKYFWKGAKMLVSMEIVLKCSFKMKTY